MLTRSRVVVASLSFLTVAFLAGSARAGEIFKIDPVHSSIVFRIKHLNVSFVMGRFNNVEGKFALDEDAAKNSIDATVKADTIDTRVDKRDDDLKSTNYFDVKQFPEITFRSTKIESKGDKMEVTGDLSLHGVTKTITVTMTKVGEGPGLKNGEVRAGLECQLTIKRSDYGMNYELPGVGDEVTLWIDLEGVRQ